MKQKILSFFKSIPDIDKTPNDSPEQTQVIDFKNCSLEPNQLLNMLKARSTTGFSVQITISRKTMDHDQKASSNDSSQLDFSHRLKQSQQLLYQQSVSLSLGNPDFSEERSENQEVLLKAKSEYFHAMKKSQKHDLRSMTLLETDKLKQLQATFCDRQFTHMDAINTRDSILDESDLKYQNVLEQLKEYPLYQQLLQGLNSLDQGKLSEAKQTFGLVAAFSKANLLQQQNKDVGRLLTIVCVLAQLYDAQVTQLQGDLPNAIKIIERTLRYFDINCPFLEAKMYLQLGHLNRDLKQLQNSLDAYYQALLIYERLKWKLDIAKVLVEMARIYAYFGRLMEAQKLIGEAITIQKQHLNPLDIQTADAYYVLGMILVAQKDDVKARECFVECLTIINESDPGAQYKKSECFNMLGYLEMLSQNYKLAIKYYQQAVLNAENVKSILLAQLTNNLGLAYLMRENFKRAAQCFQNSIEILENYMPHSHGLYVKLQDNLNYCLKFQKNL